MRVGIGPPQPRRAAGPVRFGLWLPQGDHLGDVDRPPHLVAVRDGAFVPRDRAVLSPRR